MLHESFMNHEHPHKESEALDNVYGNVQMHPDLKANIKQHMSKPSTSSTSKNETPATSDESEKKPEKGMAQKLMEKTGKKLISSKATKSTTKTVMKNIPKFTKFANVAALMLDPVSAGEGSTLYTYKIDPQTGLQTAYHNHGPNKGQKVEFNFPDS